MTYLWAAAGGGYESLERGCQCTVKKGAHGLRYFVISYFKVIYRAGQVRFVVPLAFPKNIYHCRIYTLIREFYRVRKRGSVWKESHRDCSAETSTTLASVGRAFSVYGGVFGICRHRGRGLVVVAG